MEVTRKNVDKIVLLFFSALVFIRAWMQEQDNMEFATAYKSMVVPYININITGMLILITAVTFMLLFTYRKVVVDKFFMLFLLRIILYSIPILYISGDFKIGVFFAIMQTMLAYYIGYNYCGKLKEIIVVLIIFSLIIIGQVIATLFINNISIFDPYLKWYMSLPIGRTNAIGTILVPIFIIVDSYFEKKSKLCLVYFCFIFYGLLGTGSKSAIIMICGYIIIKYVLLNLTKKWTIKRVLCFVFGICFIFIIVVITYSKFKEGIIFRLSLFSKSTVYTNRLRVYKEVFDLICENPLLGQSAFNYSTFDASKAHNFILESLVETGIIGTIIYVSLITVAIMRIRMIKEKKIRVMYLSYIAAVLVHGLVEPNLFSGESDTYFWFLLGTGVSFTRKKSRELNANEKIIDCNCHSNL